MASRVGKYLLFETLGEGAFGKVKLGVHEETGEQVAVKIMDKSDIKAQEMTMNVRREIAIMKALKHRNIVNLRQVLTSHTKLYIVMDLVTGGELFTKILKEGKLPERVARRYFQQLVDGIEYCHRRGVCHRDLKPENLLIDETTGELKITDFGLSAMKGASTTEELLHTQCGSPNYCAPEIIAHHKQGYNGAKVDAWSCGIILFALLAGFLPFYDENTKVLYRMIQKEDVKFPRKFPEDARDLILCLLHKDPDRRYTLADVKRHRWFAIDYHGDDALSRSGASPPVSRRRRRGHSRSRSTDQGPRSFEPRKKSDKSDAGSASGSTSDATSNPVDTTATPSLPMDSGQHGSSSSQRPPLVPAVRAPHRPQQTIPPLPPRVPPPPPYSAVKAPCSPIREKAPAPPAIIPAVHVSHHVTPSARPVGRYNDAIRRHPVQEHQLRQSPVPHPHPTFVHGTVTPSVSAPGGSPESGNASVEDNTAPVTDPTGTYPVPSPPSNLQPAAAPPPPPFPAPYDASSSPNMTGNTSPTSALIGKISLNNTKSPLTEAVQSGSESVSGSIRPVSSPPLSSTSSENVAKQPNVSKVTHPVPQNVLNEPVLPPKTVDVNVMVVSVTPATSEEVKAPVAVEMQPSRGSPVTQSKARWNTVHIAPPPSYHSIAPVSTPSTVADGDSSWMRFKEAKQEDESTSAEQPYPVEQKSKSAPPASSSPVAKRSPVVKSSPVAKSSPVVEETYDASAEEPEKPLSLVEQRRRMYNKLADASDSPAPFPDLSFRSSSGRSISTSSSKQDLSKPRTPRYDDRQETSVAKGYPSSAASAGPGVTLDDELRDSSRKDTLGGDFGISAVSSDHYENEGQTATETGDQRSITKQNESLASTDVIIPSNYPANTIPEQSNGNVDMKVEGEGGPTSLNASATVEDEPEIPMKERLAAAVARYRRIFKLGNNIGITSSPSFSSHKNSSLPSADSADFSNGGGQERQRSTFFNRAKAVTGAWGIILTQNLDEDSDSEDEGPQVKEHELQAFSRLLDFWDNRRASATHAKGGEVILDDEETSPLSEEDIIGIQSLLQKLEPKQIEDDVSEVEDEAVEPGGHTADVSPPQEEPMETEGCANGSRVVGFDIPDSLEGNEARSNVSFADPVISRARALHDAPAVTFMDSEEVTRSSVPPPPPPPPSLPSKSQRSYAPPPPPPPPPSASQKTNSGAGNWTSRHVLPPPPPPPAYSRPQENDTNVVRMVDEVPEITSPDVQSPKVNKKSLPTPRAEIVTFPDLEVPPSSVIGQKVNVPQQVDRRRMVVTESTLRDPFRPQPPPMYQAPPRNSDAGSSHMDPDIESRVRQDTDAAIKRGGQAPQRLNADKGGKKLRRKSSTHTPDKGIDYRTTLTRDSDSNADSKSGTSGMSITSKGHRKSPSRDEHATRGLFTLGMFNRRRSSVMTSFESELAPEQCMLELGRTLMAMDCEVLMKRGETKMKCEAPVKNVRLSLSILCTHQNGVSNVQFRRGKKDRSNIDSKEFYDFCQMVQYRYQERIKGSSRKS